MKRSRTKHNLSHYRLLTGEMGQLLPVGLFEVIPGDTIQCQTRAMVRMSPLAAPIMHPIDVRIHKFYVPNRMVFPDWENFITGGPDGDDQTELPVSSPYTTQANDLMDYYGIPPGTSIGTDGHQLHLLPIYGYNRIVNEYFRDQDLGTERAPGLLTDTARIAWEKDYFTTARPWSQKGPDVTLPLGATAPVVGLGVQDADAASGATIVRETGGTTQTYNPAWNSTQQFLAVETDPDNPTYPGIFADLSAATGISVNDFREYFAIQRYQENRARYGSRYTEYLRFLGVTPSDARLQRPEYIGGGKVSMATSEVLQTAPELEAEAVREYGVGDMYGHSVGAVRTRASRYFVEEHGYVHVLLSVRPRTMYQQSIDRTWLKQSKEHFYQPELAHLGQQEIWNAEVFGGVDSSQARTTFGYQDRYDDYRFAFSKVAGEFRNVLNYWHLGRDFTQAPALNESFVTCDPSKRIYNEQNQHGLWIMVNHRAAMRRMVSRVAKPRIL